MRIICWILGHEWMVSSMNKRADGTASCTPQCSRCGKFVVADLFGDWSGIWGTKE